MLRIDTSRASRILAAICWLGMWAFAWPCNAAEKAGKNLLGNPSFEMGREQWHMDTAGKTVARFTVDQAEAAAGKSSALVSVGAVDSWGTQFGQTLDAPAPGKKYTFAVVAKAVKEPVKASLQIERRAEPWDHPAPGVSFTLSKDRWTEHHVTFQLEKPFEQGWFAYVSCTQPNAQYRVDMLRLYEGDYVPYEQAAREEMQAVQVNLFDTGAPASAARPGADLAARKGWQKLPEDETEHAFRGDAVMMNDRLAVVLRRNAPGAELYSSDAGRFPLRAVLTPTGAGKAAKLTSWSIVENSPSAAIVDATFQTPGAKPVTLRYELAMGQVYVKVESRGGADALRIEAPCRFVVLPDFFADDIVVDARDIPVDRADLPAENFLLQMLPGKDAIVMSVTTGREDARIDLAGQGDSRTIRAGEIRYGKDRKAWVAVVEGRDVWHLHTVAKKDLGKILPLDWRSPFPAQWRVDWRQSDRLSGSWEMLVERKNGEYEKHGLFGDPGTIPPNRRRWTTVLGWFEYPCWIDRQGRGHFQPFARAKFEGPALIYPISRTKATPLDTFTVVDVVRATLGVGPCEYVLDVEGQSQAMKGRSTCGTRDLLNPIYAAKQQKHKRAEIEQALEAVLVFVKHIRSRIEDYRTFGRNTLVYLASQKQAHPEAAEFLAEMESLTREIEARAEKRQAQIKTPEYVTDLTDKFRKELLDYEGDDALPRCKAITGAIVVVGGNQDELVGECRMAVKNLRQRAGLCMAVDPRVAPIANEIRRRTQEVLRNPASYEGARH